MPGGVTIACSCGAFEPPQSWGQPNFSGERKDASRLARTLQTERSQGPGRSTQFRHDLTLLRPLGTERLLDNRDHPLCLSQGRSTRPCSGAPREHPSPADARSSKEGVALPPIDVFKDGQSAVVPFHPRGPRRRPTFVSSTRSPLCHPGQAQREPEPIRWCRDADGQHRSRVASLRSLPGMTVGEERVDAPPPVDCDAARALSSAAS
jgi:hypothetical protein